MHTHPIYLDYAATTPIDARVADAMAPWVTALPGAPAVRQFGNAASTHAYGQTARAAVETARAQVGALVGMPADDVVFTSGATESNNLVVFGMARRRGAPRGRAPHLVTTRIEHKSVLDACKAAAKFGAAVSFVDADREGRVAVAALRAALRPETVLVSVMHANNETGVIQPIEAIGALCRERGIVFHVDAAQSAGKIPVDLAVLPIDLLSLASHKIYGPQGIGALIVRPELRQVLEPLIHGGGHERGLRSGTLPVHQIVAFGAAAQLAAAERAVEAARIGALRDRLQAAVLSLPGALLNGHPTERLPGLCNVSFPGLNGESLMAGLPELAVSSSAACNSESVEPSYVLLSLGRDAAAAEASIRFSVGRYTTAAEIDTAISALTRAVCWQRERLPAAGSAQIGTEARVRFKLQLAGDTIMAATYQAYGCPHTHAACAWVCERLRGLRTAEVDMGEPQEWARALQVPASRQGRLLVVEDALKQALADAKNPAQANT